MLSPEVEEAPEKENLVFIQRMIKRLSIARCPLLNANFSKISLKLSLNYEALSGPSQDPLESYIA